jgi:hypothetical protein
MNKLLIWVSVLVVAVLGGKAIVDYLIRSTTEQAAITRVRGFLNGLTPGGDFQEAFNMWETGAGTAIQNMTQDQYNAEVARLKSWLAAHRVGEHIERYEVLGATVVAPPEGMQGAAVAVACKINGRPVTILAVKYERLDWVD